MISRSEFFFWKNGMIANVEKRKSAFKINICDIGKFSIFPLENKNGLTKNSAADQDKCRKIDFKVQWLRNSHADSVGVKFP